MSVWKKNGDNLYLERYATSCIVPGGMGKLLKAGQEWGRVNNCTQIVTFADREVSDVSLYERLGFEVDKVLVPDYSYLVNSTRRHKFGYRLKRFKDDPELEYRERDSPRKNSLTSTVWIVSGTRVKYVTSRRLNKGDITLSLEDNKNSIDNHENGTVEIQDRDPLEDNENSIDNHENGTVEIQDRDPLLAINWNDIQDKTDSEVFDRLVSLFWVPEKVPVANDQKSWANLTDDERNATMKVFSGLTLLDTIQGKTGVVSLLPHAETQHEEAVYSNIHFMENIHAKSYSNIFMTLSNTPEINEAFRWSRENSNLQYKAHTIVDLYEGDDPLKRKIASVLLESFLFYSGFYLPFRFSSMGRLTNTADVIRLIVRDESIHGYYIGYRYQVSANRLTEEQREEYKDFTIGVLLDLYENECTYAEEIYDPLGWTEDVKNFMRYNANKALNNLGFDNLFPVDTTRVSPAVLSSMSSNADENHDFFSGSGSSYIIGDVEETSDDDWDF